MPNVTREKIEKFVQELQDCVTKYGRIQPKRNDSPLNQLGSTSWGGNPTLGYRVPVSDLKS